MTINGPIIDSAWEAHRDVVGCNFRGVQNMCLWDLSPVFGQIDEYGRRIYRPLDANSGGAEDSAWTRGTKTRHSGSYSVDLSGRPMSWGAMTLTEFTVKTKLVAQVDKGVGG